MRNYWKMYHSNYSFNNCYQFLCLILYFSGWSQASYTTPTSSSPPTRCYYQETQGRFSSSPSDVYWILLRAGCC